MPGSSVDLAVSGGAAAAGLRATLHHVDHGLRDAGRREADLVAQLAAAVGASFEAHEVTVDAGPNLEARARAARRGVLPAGSLTAHTMDDQAETVVLNLLRGAALDGLAAMSGATKPLLALRRHEVRRMVVASGCAYVTDPTNFDLAIRRNLVRARVLPELSRVAGRDLVPVLARQADALRADADFLDAAAEDVVPDATDLRALRAAPGALRRRRLRTLLREQDPERHPPSSSELARVEAVVAGEAVATELAGGVRVARGDGRLRVERG